MAKREKVVLAYSGGLDTSVAVQWLTDKYKMDVIALCVDLGGVADVEGIRKKALKLGAIKSIAFDARKEFVDEYVARAIKATFPQQDLLFESGDDSYTVVLPDMGLDSAVRLFEELRRKVSRTSREGRQPSLSIGVSSRGGRLIDHPTLLEEAGTAMAKASREGGNQVIGFRADASRFREVLTGAVT